MEDTRSAPTRNSKTKPAMTSVYDGQRCLGFVLKRHWVNGLAVAYEAFSADERPLGIFESQDAAAAEVWRRAHEPSGGTP